MVPAEWCFRMLLESVRVTKSGARVFKMTAIIARRGVLSLLIVTVNAFIRA